MVGDALVVTPGEPSLAQAPVSPVGRSEGRQTAEDPPVTCSPRSPGGGFLDAEGSEVWPAEGDAPWAPPEIGVARRPPVLTPPITPAADDTIIAVAPLQPEPMLAGRGWGSQTSEEWGRPCLEWGSPQNLDAPTLVLDDPAEGSNWEALRAVVGLS